MKIDVKFFIVIALLGSMTSCLSYKKVPYFQIDKQGEGAVLPTYRKENTIRYQPNDVLGITVNVIGESLLSANFNLPLQPIANDENMTGDSEIAGAGRQTYTVDHNGCIDFPTLGLIKVAGYTQSELEKRLKELISSKSLKVNPIVTVRLLNFGVYVYGEINRPGWVEIGNKEHITVMQVLALAGDLTIHGKRNDIQIFREMPDGSVKKFTVDISREDAISSPDFYVHQNDEIYVVPNRLKTIQGDVNSVNLIFSLTSLLIGLTSFVLAFSK
jgi:polysaccharide export outer membrane protein